MQWMSGVDELRTKVIQDISKSSWLRRFGRRTSTCNFSFGIQRERFFGLVYDASAYKKTCGHNFLIVCGPRLPIAVTHNCSCRILVATGTNQRVQDAA